MMQDIANNTSVLQAAAQGNAAAIAQLQASGMDVHQVDDAGLSAVHYAAQAGHAAALQALLQAGCSPHHLSDTGESPLDLAQGEECRKLLRWALRGSQLTKSTSATITHELSATQADIHKADSHTAQHQRFQASKQRLREEGRVQPTAPHGGPAPSWKKCGTGACSTKAKKEYLRWKRAQKREAGDGDSEEWEEEQPQPSLVTIGDSSSEAVRYADIGTDGPSVRPLHRGQPGSKDAQPQVTSMPGSGTNHAVIPPRTVPSAAVLASAAEAAAAIAELKGAPVSRRTARQYKAAKAQPSDLPLRYVALEELPAGDLPAGVRQMGYDGPMCMARCIPAEVGFGAEGGDLGMPKRPAWRGIARTPQQLHALEEASFQAWVDGLYARYSRGRISFFEPRLDYWRQLWRVLERSDIALIIVDARNPLLHFSEALMQHVLLEQRLQAILVLNKSDLVPSAASQAWTRWFETRYPGLRVVSASAGQEGGRIAAENIINTILGLSIRRDGEPVKVHDILQATGPEILEESRRRNTHSKRDQAPAAASATAATHAADQQHQDDNVDDIGSSASSDEGEEGHGSDNCGAEMEAAGLRRHQQHYDLNGRPQHAPGHGRNMTWHLAAEQAHVLPGSDAADSENASSGGGGQDWGGLKSKKTMKKDAVRKKRELRMGAATGGGMRGSKGGAQAAAATAATTAIAAGSCGSRGRQQHARKTGQQQSGTAACAVADGAPAVVGLQQCVGSRSNQSRSQGGRKAVQQQLDLGGTAAGAVQGIAAGSAEELTEVDQADDHGTASADESREENIQGDEVDGEDGEEGSNLNSDFEGMAEDVFDDEDDNTAAGDSNDAAGHADGGVGHDMQAVRVGSRRAHQRAMSAASVTPTVVQATSAIRVGGSQTRATGRGANGRFRNPATRPVVVCLIGEPNTGKSSTMNALMGTHRVAVSSHPGRTKHYQTHLMTERLMLCDCPGLVFPRLDVSLPMQILYGSYPIARCRDPYAVMEYLAQRIWPRIHVTLALRRVSPEEGLALSPEEAVALGEWSVAALCEAYAARHSWRSKRGGRLDVYRAANFILRSALAGRNGINLAFLPPT